MLWKPVLDCSSGLNCSTTSCLQLLQLQPTVVHPQLRSGGISLAVMVCAFVPHSLQEGAICSSLFTQDYSCYLLQICWATRLRILLPPLVLCTSVCVMKGETSAGSPRAVVPFHGTAKVWHSLAKKKKKKVSTVLFKGHCCFSFVILSCLGQNGWLLLVLPIHLYYSWKKLKPGSEMMFVAYLSEKTL